MQAPVIEDEFSSIREHFESDIDLTDEEVDKIADVAVTYIRELLGFFGEEHISIDEYDGDEGELILDISGGDLAVLIGRHGKTLDALQMVVSSYLSNRLKFHYPIVVDIEGYKSRRREKLAELARSAAARAKKQHGRVAMAPMNAYDRRIVHLALIDDDEVTTHSEGNEPERRVIVTYVKA
ncbi:MAG: KH domain-containing protein [Parafannyhessea umbonata]|uniref:KH domain-containing protein n=1 Tax=Parafannyhessea umbonata TaxID=604330 RepID=A0A6N7X9G1_9ACTN|nr:R3H domain-containing nucleic acid-binding protein [Parafannyhessea umbonata]MDD6358781.1 KH domain-containing protein [Parafannyhessea umbonata]MST60902.1 KH domain-containing protein [Parafannyhessea umbonata]